MVELDLQLTADGRLVAFHDRAIALARGETRPLSSLTVEQIERCRPLWLDGEEVRVYRVPTLEAVLAAAPPELPLNLELKRYDAGTDPIAMIEPLAEALEGRRQVLVSSFDPALLAAARRRLPTLPLAPLGRRDADWRELRRLAVRLEAFSIHVSRHLAAALAAGGRPGELAAAERPVLAYTVNRAVEARRLLAAGLAGVFTDRPGELRRALERPEPAGP